MGYQTTKTMLEPDIHIAKWKPICEGCIYTISIIQYSGKGKMIETVKRSMATRGQRQGATKQWEQRGFGRW